ncbi:DUF1643 domain-containing protein [Paenibacillus harenae]|uniref:DUF1643 domain-containing protein n=1 Tax=Paenibacillus harenae TaxID=306543 RepID=A0ABT9U5P1_PAEHA|nr:DUF1643 domain-containing protein [Paenibacillus harenae]MDQ0114962.1 hypothetical protein [Paenibacillus harenae]
MQITFDFQINEESGAIFDITGQYRYALWRIWDQTAPRITFIMLNPSTANEWENDPTIRRCINFAKDWGFGSLGVVNLFAIRATNPIEIFKVNDPIGMENDHYIIDELEKSDLVILAWGTKGSYLNRDKEVLRLLSSFELYAIDISKEGHPKHPLYLKANATPIKYTNS